MDKIVTSLVEWYYRNKRMLPWRTDRDPYHVWVSEIMLQQTRIEAVIGYYERFMKELPTIQDLASCPQDRLLKLWEGLGYYNRVRNLQKAAQMIVEEYHNRFPNTYSQILSLPGIGEYTASAISSICFSLKEATVDGNVLRVYMRVNNCYDNIDDIKVRKRVRKDLIPIMPEDAGGFNEALMELGETICIPNGVPKCGDCPIQKFCKAYAHNTILDLPIRNPKKEKKIEDYTVFLLVSQNMVAIEKRQSKGLLHNMWQFPNVEKVMTLSQVQTYLEERKLPFSAIEKANSYIHIFTHKKWSMQAYFVVLKEKIEIENAIWVSFHDLEKTYAIPTAFQPFKNYLKERIKQNDEA